MKKLILFAALLFTYFQSSGSHASGSEIWYEYLGPAANNQEQYVIYIATSYDTYQFQPAVTEPICITSSCSSDIMVSANALRLDSFPSQSCTADRYYRHVLSDTVSLSKCSDWKFRFASATRVFGLGNISTVHSSRAIVEASLNNLHSPGSSGYFKSGLLPIFCETSPSQKPYVWNQRYQPPLVGHDSIRFVLDDPHRPLSTSALCDSLLAIPFKPGFSKNQPLSTYSGFYLDASSGLISFDPLSTDSGAALNFKVELYKFDNANSVWYKSSSMEREMEVWVMDSCNFAIPNMILEHQNPFTGTSKKISCGDSVLHFATSSPFVSSSLAANGSDFVLYSSRLGSIPVISSSTNNHLTDTSISITTYIPFPANDTLTLESRIGTDKNRLVGTCGYDLDPNQKLTFYTEPCGSMSREEKRLHEVQIFPNPAKNYISFEKLPSATEIRLLNINGRVVSERRCEGSSFKFGIDSYPSGIYFLQLSDDKGFSISRKLIKL